MLYIYTRKTHFLGRRKKKGFWIDVSMIFGLIFERLLDRCWRGFGEIFRHNFDIFLILLCISCRKGFGKGFGSNFNRVGVNFDSFLKIWEFILECFLLVVVMFLNVMFA